MFDIVNFYPSITANLQKKALIFAKQHTNISEQDVEIIMHCRKSLLFDKGIPWAKKDNKETNLMSQWEVTTVLRYVS